MTKMDGPVVVPVPEPAMIVILTPPSRPVLRHRVVLGAAPVVIILAGLPAAELIVLQPPSKMLSEATPALILWIAPAIAATIPL